MNSKIFVAAALLLSWTSSFTQIVETVAGPSPRINNGLVVGENGNVFASDLFGSGFNGNRIYKIAPDGSSDLYASGLSQPAGLIFDDLGILYVAEFTGGRISTVDGLGNVMPWISGLRQPADLIFDTLGNLYVTNYGDGSISKITPDRTVSNFIRGLSQSVGLAIDDENNYLYSANLNDGKIYQIDLQGNKSLLATIDDTPIGFMCFFSDRLFVTSTGGHKIYQIDLNGTVGVLAGTGRMGTNDGGTDVAEFTNPDGIAINASGDSIYVSENNSNLLRRIILDPTTELKEEGVKKSQLTNIQLFPNPAIDMLRIQFELRKSDRVELTVVSSVGKILKQTRHDYLPAGVHRIDVQIGEWPSDVYFVKLKTESATESIKLDIF